MTRKTTFFEGWSWLKFNKLGLALGTNLKFYTSLPKRLKLIVQKFWGLNLTFVEVTRKKLVGGGLFNPPSPYPLSWIGLMCESGHFFLCFPVPLLQHCCSLEDLSSMQLNQMTNCEVQDCQDEINFLIPTIAIVFEYHDCLLFVCLALLWYAVHYSYA